MEKVSKPVINPIPNISFRLYLMYNSAVNQEYEVKKEENKHDFEYLETIEKRTSRLKIIVSKQFERLLKI